MAKVIVETSPDINLNISTDEIVRASVDTSGGFMEVQYRVKRICSKIDNDLKAIMDAHLEERASHYSRSMIIRSQTKNTLVPDTFNLTE